MKKTVSITLGGLIFQIEEDAYELLKPYFENVTRFFSSYDDSPEIIKDIENRAAEILLNRLGKTRQSVTIEDAEFLVKTLGEVKDFVETEAESIGATSQASSSTNQDAGSQSGYARTERNSSYGKQEKLVRDGRNRLIAGVCSGLGHYFGIDTIWIRLITLALFFGLFIFVAAPFIVMVSYIALWIVLPKDYSLSDGGGPKLYRDSTNGYIAGIAAGLANYLKVSAGVVRLLLVLGIFVGGASVILYLLLWIITPKTSGVISSMESRGEPVTLENISNNIESNRYGQQGSRNLSNTIDPIFGSLFKGITAIIGVFIIVINFLLLWADTVVALSLSGILNDLGYKSGDFQIFFRDAGADVIWSGYATAAIPSLMLIVAGAYMIRRDSFRPRSIFISLAAVWLVALSIFSITGFNYAMEFSQDHNDTKTIKKDYPKNYLVIKAADSTDVYDSHEQIDLEIEGYEADTDKTFSVVCQYSVQARNAKSGKEWLSAINYSFAHNNNSVTLPLSFKISKDKPYRFQQVDVKIVVPYNTPFILDTDLIDPLSNSFENYDYWEHSGSHLLLCELNTDNEIVVKNQNYNLP